MKRVALLAVLAASLAIPTPSMAQQQGGGHDGHAVAAGGGAEAQASRAYREAMDRMHIAMSKLTDTGDADIDFARGMIPHHQAAIDMARAEIEHGTDPQLRKMAEDIIAAQEREIAELESWLQKKGVR